MARKTDSEVRLYTTMPHVPGGPLSWFVPVSLNDAIGEKGLSHRSLSCEGENPGVIVQNSDGSHSIYGLHSIENLIYYRDTKGLYGYLESPKNLLKLIGHADKCDAVINGCVIEIYTGSKKSLIRISPDFDLRTQFPERFDDSLVKSLERTISEYIFNAKTKEIIEGIVMSETVKCLGSPTSYGFWGRLHT
jgi:hypothetical protein